MTDNSIDCNPAVLDRLLDVMHHFHCREPGEMEELLELPDGCLAVLFRDRGGELSREAEDGLVRAGVRRSYIREGSGAMLDNSLDAGRLRVMTRHAAHMLLVISRAKEALTSAKTPFLPLNRVADGRRQPTALEEELIALLIEALNDPQTRERLLKFVRSEAENRNRRGQQPLL